MLKTHVRGASALLAGLAVLGAACGSSKTATTTSSSGATTSAAPSTSAAPAGATCSGLAIASFQELTGADAGLGITEKNGAQIAIDQFNAKNPNCQITFKPLDSEGSPDKAAANAKTLVDDKSVVAVVGPAFSGESKNAGPVFAAANLPTITASATNPGLSQNGWKTFHRILAGDPIQGAGLAKFISGTLKGAKVFIIDDASTYGAGLATIVKTALGSAVAGSDTIDPKGSDYNAAVTKAKDANADVVFFGGYYDAAGKLAKQLSDGGVKATFVSGDGTKDPGFVKSGGASTEGAYVSCTCADASSLAGGADFVAAYKAKFNSDAGTYAAEAFDAANFFLAAITAGKQDRASINDYVSSNSYQGITKLVKFDATGEVQATDVFMYQVKNGVLVGIGKVS